MRERDGACLIPNKFSYIIDRSDAYVEVYNTTSIQWLHYKSPLSQAVCAITSDIKFGFLLSFHIYPPVCVFIDASRICIDAARVIVGGGRWKLLPDGILSGWKLQQNDTGVTFLNVSYF